MRCIFHACEFSMTSFTFLDGKQFIIDQMQRHIYLNFDGKGAGFHKVNCTQLGFLETLAGMLCYLG